jgi:putative hemolysin
MFDLLIVFALVLLNGCFALSELAIVSSRRPRLRAMAEAGRSGAQAALALAEDPGRFLSTVQIGITLVGVVAGAFSGATLGGALALQLQGLGVPEAVAEPLGFGLVIAAVTFLSIVVGELVPKRFALRSPEAIACLVAPAMTLVARVGAPAVWLLDTSTGLIFRLLGQSDATEEPVTKDDVRSMVAEEQARRSVWAPDCPVEHAVVVHKSALPLEANDPQEAAHRTPAWHHDGADQQHFRLTPTALGKQQRKWQDHRGEGG